MKKELPRGVQVLECKSIEFAGKDIIIIEKWDDFMWLLGSALTIFKIKNCLYYVTSEVAYIYELEE